MWSRRFAHDIAKVLGFLTAETVQDGKDNALRQDGTRVVEEITEHIRYLPLEQVNWTEDMARFLVQMESNGGAEQNSLRWQFAKLRELCAFVAFLRGCYGTEQPADESDEWTDEDRHDFTLDSLRRLEEKDPYPWPENSADAQAG